MSEARGSGPNPWLVASVVTLGAFMEVLDTTIVNVALPHIAGSLAVSSDDATWTLTTYLVANGIVLTISGALTRRIGRKAYFLVSIAGFTAMSFGCGVSTSFPELLLFRMFQGFFGGGLQPSQQQIILDVFPPEKRQQGFSIAAVATIIAPALGPLVGGYLTDNYSWNWIFLINIPIGVVTFLGVLHLVEDKPAVSGRGHASRFDYLGTAFIALALGCLELGFDRGEDYDWLSSSFVQFMFATSLVGFLLGVPYLLLVRHPVVDLRVFKDRNFALSWIAVALMGFVLYASSILVPQFAQQQLGYTATLAGLVLTPGAVVLMILIPVVSRLLGLAPVKYVIVAGSVAMAVSLFYSARLVSDVDFFHLALFRTAQSAALALLFVPISTAAYVTVPEELNEDAAALFSMSRNVVGGVGISIATALVTDQQQVRQNHLIATLSPSYQPYQGLLHQVQQAFIDVGTPAAQAIRSAPGEIYQMLQTQAAVLAYNDVFIMMGLASLLLAACGFLLSNAKPKATGGGAA